MPPTPVRLKPSASLRQTTELLVQALETEVGGIQVYQNALQCARNKGLKAEWAKYLDQTRNHEKILRNVLDEFGLDAELETPGRAVVRSIGEGLVAAMTQARQEASPQDAELVATECVILAETKDHFNWELIGEVAKSLHGEQAQVLKAAFDEVEDEEDEHLYHTVGWARELWLQALELPAVLPPPEERKDVKSAIAAEHAKDSRASLLRKAK